MAAARNLFFPTSAKSLIASPIDRNTWRTHRWQAQGRSCRESAAVPDRSSYGVIPPELNARAALCNLTRDSKLSTANKEFSPGLAGQDRQQIWINGSERQRCSENGFQNAPSTMLFCASFAFFCG